MPAPKSQITQLVEGLKKAPELAGINLQASAKKMSKVGAPPRIVIYPTVGKIVNPRNKATANRDIDRTLVAHIWGKDFDEACYLQTLLVQALVNQGAGGDPISVGQAGGTFWSATEEEWDYSEDSDRQGEEVYIAIVAINSLDKISKGTGQVNQIAYNALTGTTLTAPMTATDAAATVTSTFGFPYTGLLTIDSEQMQYASLTATTFAGLIRGVNGTTAATHSNAATVNVT